MGPRNLLILFFSTLAVSLVILIILFSLFFKNVDLNFETRLPDSAPDLEELYGDLPEELEPRAERASIQVPQEYSTQTVSSSADEDEEDERLGEPVGRSSEADSLEPPKSPEPQGPSAPTPPPSSGGAEESPAPARGDVRDDVKDEAKKEEKKLEPVVEEARPTSYQVYMGGFSTREAAQAKAEELGQGLVRGSEGNFILQFGVFSSKSNADNLAGQVGGSVRQLD